jgi:hypothetical protein
MQFNKRKIFAICGNAGVGKDPLAEKLRIVLGYDDTIHVNFANPIKEMLSILNIGDFTNKDKMTRFGLTKRELLISLGTKWGKNLLFDRSQSNYGEIDNYMDIWVTIFNETINNKYNKDRNIICSDLRFIDEYHYIKKIGGFVIRILGEERYKINHESEQYFKNFNVDYELDDTKDYMEEAKNIVKFFNCER